MGLVRVETGFATQINGNGRIEPASNKGVPPHAPKYPPDESSCAHRLGDVSIGARPAAVSGLAPAARGQHRRLQTFHELTGLDHRDAVPLAGRIVPDITRHQMVGFRRHRHLQKHHIVWIGQ